MPFLRLTRDRRGFENTFLLHADHPGAKARLLYWYRTAPGIVQGRPALDEDAIRTIEENHPDIEFDWPAILALSEVMTPEEEESPKPPSAAARRPSASARKNKRELRRDERADVSGGPVEQSIGEEPVEPVSGPDRLEPLEPVEPREPVEPVESPRSSLVDDLAGREVGRALRARYAEIKSKIDAIDGDRRAWLKRAEAINPDAWDTPEAVLQGVSNADAAYEQLKTELP